MVRGTFAATGAAALIAVCAAFQPAAAKVDRDERVTYYEVSGDNIDAIMTQLDTHGPPDDTGERFHGRTDARIDWAFNLRSAGDGCAVRDVLTRLHVNLIMPRLATTDAEVREHFGEYVERLSFHEKGHIDNARKTAVEIDAALRALPPESSCKAMKEKANALGHRLFDVGAARDVAYDRSTDHGRIQGAHYP
jgi:predicted secreted Zn-dependent protease